MYYTSLPDHSDPQFDEEKHFRAFRERNIIFNARVRKSSCADHVGCLSIKTTFSGEEWYTINGVKTAVRKNSFLLLNEGQNYGSCIQSDTPVDSFSIFFQSRFASAVLRDVLTTEEKALDNPFDAGEPLEFFQTLYSMNAELEGGIIELLQYLDLYGYATAAVDERLIFFLRHLIRKQRSQYKNVISVAAVKPSTRKEVYRRLCTAKDVMHSLFGEPLDLTQLSIYAGISVPQLVRQFKAVFGCTPHQYLIDVRLQYAVDLLTTTSLSIADITMACGLEDSSAFCRLFRKRYHSTPQSYRRQHS